MTKRTDLGLPSAIKDSTYQQNRDTIKLEYPVGFAFMSKGELIRSYEALMQDRQKDLFEIERLKSENRFIRGELVDMQRHELEEHRKGNAYMKVV